MSNQLTPEQQREVRARYGGDVQSMDQMIAGHQQQVCDFISSKLGVPMDLTREDKVRAAIVEAAYWIRTGAPGRALEVLESAMRL